MIFLEGGGAVSGPKSVNLLGDPGSKKHTSYVRLDDFNLNPFTIVGYREKSRFSPQIHIFRRLYNRAEAHISSLGFLCYNLVTIT